MRQLIDLARIGGVIGLHRPQLLVVAAQLRGEFLLARTESAQPGNDHAAFVVEHGEQAGEQPQQPRLLLIFGLRRERPDVGLRLFDGYAALRHIVEQLDHLLVLPPVILVCIKWRT